MSITHLHFLRRIPDARFLNGSRRSGPPHEIHRENQGQDDQHIRPQVKQIPVKHVIGQILHGGNLGARR